MGRTFLHSPTKILQIALLILVPLIAGLGSCVKEKEPGDTRTYISVNVPKGFAPPYVSAQNPLTAEGVALGRKLFFDPILSSNGRSCNSCHKQELSFMIKNVDMGLDPSLYGNIPPLINLAWNPDYDWAGSQHDLDVVAVGDFGPLFFNSNIEEVIQRLKSHKDYPEMFRKAFPDEDKLVPGKMQLAASFALAQFLRTIVTAESEYDKFISGKQTLSPNAQYGHDIFMSEKGDCFHCHSFPLFTDNQFHNIGLDSVFTEVNKGRQNVTGLAKDMGLFSTPTLRNISLTGPYMHDGRFQTLDEVIEHYNSGVKKSSTLDPIMTKAGKENGLNLTSFEKQCLKEFLLTLTDTAFLHDPRFSKPE